LGFNNQEQALRWRPGYDYVSVEPTHQIFDIIDGRMILQIFFENSRA
jgi:hypothetical protein